MKGRVVRALATGALLVLVAGVASAQAAYPGQNGKIAFSESHDEDGYWVSFVHTVNPNGSGDTVIGRGYAPEFSPDGTKIAAGGGIRNADGTNPTAIPNASNWINTTWSPDQTRLAGDWWACLAEANCIYGIDVINRDGTGKQKIASGDSDFGSSVQGPSWSPRGDLIAYTNSGQGWTMRPDGTQKTPVVVDGNASAIDWSPDGTRFAFWRASGGATDIFSSNADGSNVQRLTDDPAFDSTPAWSPDGSKIVFQSNRSPAGIYTMNADGTNETLVAAHSDATSPSWQPLPYPGYARPKGASPVRAALVPAFAQCTAPNRTHGAPLSSGSCAPPAEQSSNLTVGTAMNSFVSYETVTGNPATPADEADIAFRVELTDVRVKGTLDDYTGEVQPQATTRLTDRGSGGPATVADMTLPLTTQCTPTAATDVGSTCSLTTTLDTLIPGLIVEGRRSLVQLSQVQVIDGGSDGDTATEPNQVFLRQGVFVP